MDVFDIDPNALIILVIMVIGGLKWMIERMKGEQAGLDDDQQHSDTPFQDLYEEARREIQQRQGGPPAQELARPVNFEQLSPPASVTPPPLPTAATRIRKPAPERNYYEGRSTTHATLTPAEKAALARLKEQGFPSHSRRRSGNRVNVRRLLSSPAATREAIVLREILGPPKGAGRGY